jgi:hypothetical protein
VKVTKDILYPGVYHLPNGEKWECSPADVRNAAVQGRRMLAAGNIAPPLIWGHDYLSVPMPVPVLLSMIRDGREFASSTAKNTFGYATGFDLETVKGDPVLMAKIEIPSDKDAEQFAKTRYVSPRVDRDYTDSNGRSWRGATIGHIASTPLPVQSAQRPVMLSTDWRHPGRSRSTVFLSLESRSMPAEPKPGDSNAMGRILSALSLMAMSIPESVKTPEDLALALETMAANQTGGGFGDPAPTLDEMPTGEGDMPTGDETEDESMRPAMSPAMLSALPTAAQASLRQAADSFRASLLARIKRVASVGIPRGVVAGSDIEAMRATVNNADTSLMLSVQQSGSAKSRVLFQLETFERACGIRPGSKAKDGGTNLSRLQSVHPPALDGALPKTRADELAEAARARMAVKPATKQ